MPQQHTSQPTHLSWGTAPTREQVANKLLARPPLPAFATNHHLIHVFSIFLEEEGEEEEEEEEQEDDDDEEEEEDDDDDVMMMMMMMMMKDVPCTIRVKP